MVEVKFYDNVADELLKFAVIISKTDNKWVFCKHKERETYEVPGGHREPGESIFETAKKIEPICVCILLKERHENLFIADITRRNSTYIGAIDFKNLRYSIDGLFHTGINLHQIFIFFC